MTVARTGGASRAPSTRPTSVARDIAKRRNKPYKTEQSRVLAKKRKLILQTTHARAPAGFSYLPLGTPDLANRCKELSRLRGAPVHVVNAQPVSKEARDPSKISHHIHRVGYHFRSDVVDDACQELGYTYHNNRFVKEKDLVTINERSVMARAMAKHGIHLNDEAQRETDDQIRAAIKELFPRIPEEDLKEILRHAWASGSNRVGTVASMDLPRRVQLAVIARIRHAYTDYDYLLRSFRWENARAEVEPDCLQKLIEWRGENQDNEEDNELEEVLRETIVIDDDDEDDSPEVIVIDDDDDDDSTNDMAKGYNSDTSFEISHRVAADEDLGAESHDEDYTRFLGRHQRQPPNSQNRHSNVRQMIGAARERYRSGREPVEHTEIVQVHVPETTDGVVTIDGKQYRRVTSSLSHSGAIVCSQSLQLPPREPMPAPSPYWSVQLPPSVRSHGTRSVRDSQMPQAMPPPMPYPSGHGALLSSPSSPAPFTGANSKDIERVGHWHGVQSPFGFHTESAEESGAPDRVVASIEPQSDLRKLALATSTVQSNRFEPGLPRSRGRSPGYESPEKRLRLDCAQPSMATKPSYYQPAIASQSASQQLGRQDGQPGRYVDTIHGDYRHGPSPAYGSTGIAQGVHSTTDRPIDPTPSPRMAQPAEYDPAEPLLRPEDYREHGGRSLNEFRPYGHNRLEFMDAQVAPVQYVSRPEQRQEQLHQYRPAQYRDQGREEPQLVYVRPYQSPQHGAPAAVQQVPREQQFVLANGQQHLVPAPQPYPPQPQPQPQPQPYYSTPGQGTQSQYYPR